MDGIAPTLASAAVAAATTTTATMPPALPYAFRVAMPATPNVQIVEEAVKAFTTTVNHRGLSGTHHGKAAKWTVHVLHLWPAVVAEVYMALDTALYPAPKSVMWVLMQRYISLTTAEADTFLLEAPTEAYLRLLWLPKAQATHEKAVAQANKGLEADLAANIKARAAWQTKRDRYIAQKDRRNAKVQVLWAAAKAKSKAKDTGKVPRPNVFHSDPDESEPSDFEQSDSEQAANKSDLLTSPAALAAGVPAWHNPQSNIPGGLQHQAPPGPDLPAAMACLAKDMGWLKGASHPGLQKYVVTQHSQEPGQAFLPITVLPIGPPPGYRLTAVKTMGLVCGFHIHGLTLDLRHLPTRRQQANSWPASTTTSPPTLSCMKVAYKCDPGRISLVAWTLMLRAMWQEYDIACCRWPDTDAAATQWRTKCRNPPKLSELDIVHYDGCWDADGGLHCEQYVPDPACVNAPIIPFHEYFLSEAWAKAVRAV